MVDYLYDGTFEGLLTCIYYHYYFEKARDIYLRDEYQSSLLGGYKDVETDEEKAEIVYEAIKNKISVHTLRRIYTVYRSTVDKKEKKILDYVRYGFVKGSCISLLHGDPIVFAVQEAERKVTFEVHRLKGLIRFSELGSGVLYSPISPDHDVLEFLAEHFTDRFKNEPFVIHDTNRDKALVAYHQQWYIREFTKEQVGEFSENEAAYQKLWQEYFENMAIKERINPKCQKNMMPKRYWKNLTEFNLQKD